MKKLKNWSIFFISAIFFISCGEAEERNTTVDSSQVENAQTTSEEAERNIDRTLTQAERDALSPDSVVAEFKQGNERFILDSLTPRNRQERISATGEAQYPKAMVLSCIDSRVPIEEIFDQGLGDLFIGRIAGNFADEEMLGSMEFATRVAGSKTVVVVGHSNCGAVKSAIDNVELGNITAMLEHIKPAVEMTTDFPEEQRNIKNLEYVNEVVKNNVRHTIAEIRDNSSIIADMENNGEIKVLGAFYDVSTGRIEFL